MESVVAALGEGADDSRARSHSPRRNAGAPGPAIRSSPTPGREEGRQKTGRRALLPVSQLLSSQLGVGGAGSGIDAPGSAAAAAGDDGMGVVDSSRLVHDAIDQAVAEEFEKRRYPEVAAHYKKCAQKLASRIESLQKTNARLLKAKADLEIFNKNEVPKGYREFAPSFETPLLDSEELNEDFLVEFKVNKGTSIREAKKVLHTLASAAQKSMDVKIMERQRSLHKEGASKAAFIASCVAIPGGVKSEDMFSLLDLDDGDIQVPELDSTKLEAKAVSLYLKTVEAAAKAKKKAEESKLKIDAAQAKTIASVVSKSPEQLVQETVKLQVDVRLQALGLKGKSKVKGKDKGAPKGQHKGVGKGNTVASESKNGFTPTKGGGKNKNQNQQNKGAKNQPWTSKPKEPHTTGTKGGGKGVGRGKGKEGTSKGKHKGSGRT